MSVLIIDDNVRKSVKELIAYAQKHPVDLRNYTPESIKEITPIGDNPNHVLYVYKDLRVVYSEELQPSGRYRHISMSIKEGRVPTPQAAQEVCKLFNFGELSRDKQTVWFEKGPITAINIVEKIEGDTSCTQIS